MASQQTQTAPGMTWEDEQKLKLWIVDKIGESLDSKQPQERTPETVQLISERFDLLCSHGKINLADPHRTRIKKEVLDELLGFGPIEPLLQDDSLTEVMVNARRQAATNQGPVLGRRSHRQGHKEDNQAAEAQHRS